MEKRERHRSEILCALKQTNSPMSSTVLAEYLAQAGYNLHERTIRLYLRELDEEALTECQGKRGRVITSRGLAELRASRVLERVGYLSAKIDQMTFQMTFDLATRTGRVVVNMSLIDPLVLAECADQVGQVFASGLAMGNRLAVVPPGETVGDVTVPPGTVGFCTVCSITLNGVLLKHGVPTTSRFGGLMEVHTGRPRRFVEIIHYDGTSIDPLEVFIRSGMTDCQGAVANGHGLVGASFRELPAGSRNMVMLISERVSAVGLGGFVEIGWPDRPILGLSVADGRIGTVVIGGLNPIAILEETGHRVYSRAMAGLLEYNRLQSFEDLPQILKCYR